MKLSRILLNTGSALSLVCLLSLRVSAQEGESSRLTVQKITIGTKPIPISLSGFSGEVDKVLRFDLEVAGCEVGYREAGARIGEQVAERVEIPVAAIVRDFEHAILGDPDKPGHAAAVRDVDPGAGFTPARRGRRGDERGVGPPQQIVGPNRPPDQEVRAMGNRVAAPPRSAAAGCIAGSCQSSARP